MPPLQKGYELRKNAALGAALCQRYELESSSPKLVLTSSPITIVAANFLHQYSGSRFSVRTTEPTSCHGEGARQDRMVS